MYEKTPPVMNANIPMKKEKKEDIEKGKKKQRNGANENRTIMIGRKE